LVEELAERALGSRQNGEEIIFHVSAPSLKQIQQAALLGHPLPANSFRVTCL